MSANLWMTKETRSASIRILRIGDPHIKFNNLDEAEKLMDFVVFLVNAHRPDRIEILGDLFHTHSIIRLEVLEFWDRWIDVLASSWANIEVVILVGNHDQTGDYSSSSHALSVFTRIKRANLSIVSNPSLKGIYAYVPYIHDHKQFVELANSLANQGAKILVCHQTFNGAKYESGIFAPDGIDPKLLNFDTIISGHIHSTQQFANITYPGTPKWDTDSDANEKKGVWLFEHDDRDGKILSSKLFSTDKVVTPIISLVWNEGEPMPEIPENAKVSMELVGKAKWVDEAKEDLKGRVKLSSTVTDRASKVARKPGNSFLDFLQNLYVNTADKDALISVAKEYDLV